ncbi:hypothetical protein CP09DC77_1198B, partial [Chlamydia psittaci 09DC77]
ISLTTD